MFLNLSEIFVGKYRPCFGGFGGMLSTSLEHSILDFFHLFIWCVFQINPQTISIEMSLKKTNKFLRKLFEILDNQEYFHIISWDSDGQCVLIKDVEKMQTEIIPAFFSLKKLASFIRQLHIYDFHKVKSKSKGDTQAFLNQLFNRWDRDQAAKIIRKRKTKKQKEAQSLTSKSDKSAFESLKEISDRNQSEEDNISIENIGYMTRQNISYEDIYSIIDHF